MADDLDLITYDEAIAALSLNPSRVPSSADQIELWVTAISRRVDSRVGAVVKRTVTDTLTPDGPTLVLSTKNPYAITSVTEYIGGVASVLTAEDEDTNGTYLFRNGELTRRSGWSTSKWQGETVVVVYTAGLFDSTEDVDADYKIVAGSALRRLWAREAGAWARANPFDNDDQGAAGFFKVIDPVIDEWLDRSDVVGIA